MGISLFVIFIRKLHTCENSTAKKQYAASAAAIVVILAVWMIQILPSGRLRSTYIQEGTLTSQGYDDGGDYFMVSPKGLPGKQIKLYCTRTEAGLCVPGTEYLIIRYYYHPGQEDTGYLSFMVNPESTVRGG